MTFPRASELPKMEKVEKLPCECQQCWILVIYMDNYIQKPVPIFSGPRISVSLAKKVFAQSGAITGCLDAFLSPLCSVVCF